MSISSLIRKAKDKVRTEYNARQSRNAFYKAHPEAQLRELKEEQKALKTKEEIRTLKKENLKARFHAVAGFVGGPTAQKARTGRVGQTYAERASQGVNPAFSLGGGSGLGVKRETFTLGGKPNPAFGLGNSRGNSPFSIGGGRSSSPFGLGPERKEKPKKKTQRRIIIYQ